MPLNMASITAVATTELESYTVSPALGLVPAVPRQPSTPEPEDPHTVCYHLALMAVIVNYCSFSVCLLTPRV